VTGASALLAQLSSLGARVEQRDGRLVIRAGSRAVPKPLVDDARALKRDILRLLAGRDASKVLTEAPKMLNTERSEHLRQEGSLSVAESPGVRRRCSDFSHLSIFDEDERLHMAPESPIEAAGEAAILNRNDRREQCPPWGEAEEERAAIVEFAAEVPRAWAEGFTRLDPNRPPSDVPPGRWLIFIDDIGRFLDEGWAAKAAARGWSPYELFGCDRDRPFARTDQAGLLWLMRGHRLAALSAETAVIETLGEEALRYARRPRIHSEFRDH
jgi:hypothetical protein